MVIGFFSDVHANLPALEAFLKDLEITKPDALYCLGDLVGYNVWANEVTEEIRKRHISTIMGNHDEALLHPFQENDNSNRGITRRIISDENRNYLINLPRELKLSFDTKDGKLGLLLVHGSPKSINDYLVEDYSEKEIEKMMDDNGVSIVLCGHTHIPYHRIIRSEKGYKHVINIGSVGKPKDGDPRLCYALLTLDITQDLNDVIKVDFRRSEYDVNAAVQGILNSDFPNSYSELLIKAK